ncbi:MAG: hypothetical protein US42_C0014G0051 [Candidatus Magasanikbacteria bacterium GW2011_GWC2_37_14]|uniref:Uncharacterized protein n=1 Tax=Candidatus Magasanikbacteria bacterium GW2011_GWC2_37_14 TaxID=1619046 RepID=A0A0G0ISP0_9BACT|nr:MAG: hypothetical protein US42_C0014G0051 [Candidatus Magasanikbacteria bacterium GW2011_GWC2_37_14]
MARGVKNINLIYKHTLSEPISADIRASIYPVLPAYIPAYQQADIDISNWRRSQTYYNKNFTLKKLIL